MLLFLFLIVSSASANEVLDMLRNESVYISTKGLIRVEREGLVEAVPVLVERILDEGTDGVLKKRMIDTLVKLGGNESLSATVNTAHNLYAISKKRDLLVPKDMHKEGSLETVIKKLSVEIGNHTCTYLVRRTCRHPMLRNVEVLSPFIEAKTPSLVKAAALLAIKESQINHVQLADPLLKLSRDKRSVVRALAYRALCEKLPADDFSAFIKDGLKDKSAIVREAILLGILEKQPRGVSQELTKLHEVEKDERLAALILDVQDSLRKGLWFDRFLYLGIGIVVLILLAGLAMVPSVLKRQRERQLVQALELMKQADYDHAALEFRSIMKTSPQYHDKALLHLLRALVRANKMEEATVIFGELDPKNYELDDLYALATDLDGKGLKARAVGLYLQIMGRDKDYGDVQKRFDTIDERFGGGGKKDNLQQRLSSGVSLTGILKDSLSAEYEGFELIGKGGMGAVFSAVNRKSREKVAIKVLSPHLADKEAIKTRFYRESVAIANLSHKNICGIRDIRKADLPFIIMEYIDGESLKDMIEKMTKPVGKAQFLEIAIPTTDALAYAHSKSIVHRDIKPENILVTKDGIPKMVDFGLVKFKEAASDITSTGAMMGTPMYMSPEQLKGEATIDARTDLFSLGLTLYELLTLGYPFPKKAVFQRVFMEPKPLRELNKSIPAQLESIILSCIQNDPEERPSDAAELKSLLETACEYWSEN